MVKKFFLSRLISRDNVQTFVSRGSRRKWLIIVGAVVLAGLITGLVFLLTNMVNYDAAKRHVLEKGMVSIGLRGDLAGFAVKDEESGVIKGYEADIAAEMERRLFGNEVKVDYQEINSKTGKVLLDLGDLDFSLAAYVPTDAETYVAYSDPYYTDAIVFYVRKGSGITSAQEINGKTVGVVNTSYAGYNTKLEEFLKGKNILCKYKYYNAYPDAADALKAGQIDVFAGGSILMQSYAKDAQALPGFVMKHGYCIALKKSESELKKALNKLLSNMRREGLIDKLIAKWSLPDYSKVDS